MFAPTTYQSGDGIKEEDEHHHHHHPEEASRLPTSTISSLPEEEYFLNGPSLLWHDCLLDPYLRRLRLFLTVLGFDHGTHFRQILSWSFFGGFGIALPVTIFIIRFYTFEGLKFLSFIFVSQTLLAAVSLYSISNKLQKHGIVQFLFIDAGHDQFERCYKGYIFKIKGFFSTLLWWMMPCFLVKLICGMAWIIFYGGGTWWEDILILLSLVAPWMYLATIYLSACLLFNLVCNFLVMRFEEFGRFLESSSDVFNILKEHIHLRHQLYRISHRFRIFLLLILLFVTASQFITLLQTTGNGGTINLTNAGDFIAASAVQVVGISLCLHAAARITHRAQGVASIASKWHSMMTCCLVDGDEQRPHDTSVNMEMDQDSLLIPVGSESDLESLSYIKLPNSRFVSSVSSYQKRQALVMYLQANPGGITLFGWSIDRGLINTIFFFELTLVTFVLGKTVSLAST